MPSFRFLLAVPAALLVGLVAAPASDEPPSLKELRTSQNNLKQIGLAMHNYESANGKLPVDARDKDGKPLLSWRVLILPYLEEDELYKQFALDEPWDSDTNKKLVEKLPKVYAPVRGKAKAGETFYQAFAGPDTLFPEKGTGFTIGGIADGTSNTAMAVESGEPAIWTKPGGLPFDKGKPLPKLGGLFEGTFHVLMCDGSVTRFRRDFDADEMKKVVMPADGEPIDLKKLTK